MGAGVRPVVNDALLALPRVGAEKNTRAASGAAAVRPDVRPLCSAPVRNTSRTWPCASLSSSVSPESETPKPAAPSGETAMAQYAPGASVIASSGKRRSCHASSESAQPVRSAASPPPLCSSIQSPSGPPAHTSLMYTPSAGYAASRAGSSTACALGWPGVG